MQFYVLEHPKSDSPEFRAGRIVVMKPEKGVNRGEAPRCPRCNRPFGWKTWLPPYQVEIEIWGKRYGDITESGNDLIVSERFMQIFAQSKLQGLASFEPVEVVKVVHRRGRPKDPLPHYFKAAVVRSPTTIDQEASGYVWEDRSKVCPECLFDTLKRYQRLVIKQDTWNGDDVFFPRGGHGLLVSERFRSLFRDRELLGAVFIPSESEEAGYDSFPWESAANQG